jgi:hypothetical protein
MGLNIDQILLIIFGLILVVVMYFNRHRVKMEKFLFPLFYIVMYRTRLGLNAMDKYSKKYPRLLNFIGISSVVIGFIGMIFVFYTILLSSLNILSDPLKAEQGAKLLLPGIEFQGIRLSFFHWIISIFVLAIVHEFSHGLLARLHRVRVKSSGFAVLGIILPLFPAAFVEPDEKELGKKSKKAQLSMFAAGPFSNLLLAGLIFVVMFFFLNPFAGSLVESEGVIITNLDEEYPFYDTGVSLGENIIELNGITIKNVNEFLDEIKKIKPKDEVSIRTNHSIYTLIAAQHPKDKDRGYLGLNIGPESKDYKKSIIDKVGKFPISTFLWFNLLIYWMFLLNFFVGLINLFPIIITDGAKMLYVALSFFVKDEGRLKKTWTGINILCILLLLVNFLPSILKYIIKIL